MAFASLPPSSSWRYSRLWQSPSVAEAMRNHVEPSAASGGIDWAKVGDTEEREAATTLEDGHMDMLF